MPDKKPLPFNIGADPEFNVLISDRHFCAQNLFENMFAGTLEKKGMGYIVDKAGEIGWDGNDDIGELRPTPANSPEKLTENLKQLISKLIKTNPLLELSTLCDTGTIGGHMHFELQGAKAETTVENMCRQLSSFYLPIIISEDKINLRTRAKSSYGKLVDFRTGQFDGKYTFEFRAPSAEWMTTEKIAKSTLAYMATVFNEMTNKPRNFAKCKNILIKNQNQANALKDLAVSDFKIIMKSLTEKVKKYVRTFEYYPQYKEEIEFILSTEKVNKEKEKANFNMAEGWNLIKYKQPNKRQLFSRTAISKKENKNIDEIMQTIPLYFNQDTNIVDFTNHIKLKVTQLNWKMKNHYFLFGLKKGIENMIITDKNGDYITGEKQIETREDLNMIQDTLIRMNDKFPVAKKRLQFKTNENNKKYILIGLPYTMRMNLDYKPIMEQIYEIEKGRTKAKELDYDALPAYLANSNDNDNSQEKNYGKLYKIYSGKNVTENLESDETRQRQANQNLEVALQEIENESNNS